MPIYEYTCKKCKHFFEQLVMYNAVPACPKCKSESLEQMLSLCTMSSDHTKKQALKSARRKAKDKKKEEDHDYHQRLHAEYDH
jgi:putative FmdB family regulatory protein